MTPFQKQVYITKQINNNVSRRFVKWYESGLLGCGIKGLPWIDMTNIVPIPINVSDISKEIFEITKDMPSRSGTLSTIIPPEINKGQDIVSNYAFYSEKFIPEDVREKFTNLWEVDTWIYDNLSPKTWELTLTARMHLTKFWDGKHDADCEWQCELPLLRTWVESLVGTVFEHIGRVVVFKTKPGNPVFIHRDDAGSPHANHFINFQLNGKRPAFVYDEVERKKVYITSQVYTFNERDLHGVDAEDVENFTIRVDGKFLPEVCLKLNFIKGMVWDEYYATGKKLKTAKIYEPE